MSTTEPGPDRLPASVDIYDTTVRDGSQLEGISLTAEDKLRIAQQLDWLGVAYIEGERAYQRLPSQAVHPHRRAPRRHLIDIGYDDLGRLTTQNQVVGGSGSLTPGSKDNVVIAGMRVHGRASSFSGRGHMRHD